MRATTGQSVLVLDAKRFHGLRLFDCATEITVTAKPIVRALRLQFGFQFGILAAQLFALPLVCLALSRRVLLTTALAHLVFVPLQIVGIQTMMTSTDVLP